MHTSTIPGVRSKTRRSAIHWLIKYAIIFMSIMKNFTASINFIVIVTKMFHQCYSILHKRIITPSIILLTMSIKTSFTWVHSCPYTSSGRCANSCICMSIHELNTLFNQSINVRCFSLSMPTHPFN